MEDIQEDNISVGLEQKRRMYIYENQHHMTTSCGHFTSKISQWGCRHQWGWWQPSPPPPPSLQELHPSPSPLSCSCSTLTSMDRQWGPQPEQPWSNVIRWSADDYQMVIRWSADDQPAVNAAEQWTHHKKHGGTDAKAKPHQIPRDLRLRRLHTFCKLIVDNENSN